ncbi:GNAT family N-acetyltransferase [Paenibacillus sp. YN15]|uniref:GNAT family N-acetyltransferase n=1 Tax=Paenibacillus sp. YN15 TaxID=1742774 RepID=UPI000DCE7999|nr:GNAT family N-acetyltransferase [Paenibacillus sp. YN15]RAU95698.1 GNAT family N-acetyltransferase [Paenibacillus sp. YN15]
MGVRRLTAADHAGVLELFGKEADHYRFLLDDLKWNGYAGEQFMVFGEFASGRLVSLLLNNFSNLTYYCPVERDPEGYRQILGQLSFAKVSGPDRLVQQICRDFNTSKSTLSHLGMVKQVLPPAQPDGRFAAEIISAKEELREHYRLLLSAEEYSGLSGDEEGYVSREWNRLVSSPDRIMYLRLEGRMVAAASTFHEREQSALITGVVTHPDFRNKGCAAEVLAELFGQLLREGKYPYLFYTNPAARSVYLRAGMEEICPWRVTFL